ncbi:MAG: hypothetical protein MUF84_11295 [Anaerolineae bacterium]|nr:hypothetical protein [Anaerolineae bacterium]
MKERPKFYSVSIVALTAGLVLLAQVLVINGCLVRGARPAPSATPTRTPQAIPTDLSPEVATETSMPTTAPPTATTVPPTSTPRPTATSVPPTETAAPPIETAAPVQATVTPTEAIAAMTEISEAVESAERVTVPVVPRVDDPASPFHNAVWVGLYGTPAGRGLGILGRATATETVTMAVQQAEAYRALIPTMSVVPFFHMVVTIADPFPGPSGTYVHRVSAERIQLWIDVARANGMVSVLDIQPGYSSLESELAFVDPFLRQPGVHLALDPEFMMLDGVSVPGQRIGTMTGAHVNQAQAWLDAIAAEIGERKVLIIHQFDDRMFSGKADIIDYPAVALVWDADGFGGPGAKVADYRQYAAEAGFEYGGFKLFYEYDVPVMTPAQVLELVPLPAFVVYQ